MKKAIWKFEVELEDMFYLDMPVGSNILCVQIQRGLPFIWAMIDQKENTEKRWFELFATGETIDFPDRYVREYIGTFQLHSGNTVFHLFERKPIEAD